MSTATQVVPRLSWSQVDTYGQCPAKWWFSRHRKPEFTPPALKFGAAIHHVLAGFYTARSEGCNLGLDDLVSLYCNAWKEPFDADVRFSEGEDEGMLRDMAQRMLQAFLDTASPGEVLAVEEGFAVEVADGILVSGVVDLVEVKDGRFWIVDFKTSKGSPSACFDKEQIALYRMGLQELGLIPDGADVGLRYDVLRKLKTKGDFVSVPVQVSDKEVDDLKHKLAQVWKAIESGIIYRNQSWACDGCQWRTACQQMDLAEV